MSKEKQSLSSHPFSHCTLDPEHLIIRIRGRVSAELSKPVERKGAMCVVLV